MGRVLEGCLERRSLNDEDGQERWAWVGRVAKRKQTLGRYPEMSESEALKQLAYMVERVRRGVWKPVKPAPPLPPKLVATPDLYEVVDRFIENERTRGVGEAQVKDIDGLLTNYVLRHLRQDDGTQEPGVYPTPDELGVDEVEQLRDALKSEKAALDALRAKGVTHMDAAGSPLAPGDRSGEPLPRGLGSRRINRALRSLFRALDYANSRYGTPNAKLLRETNDLLLKVKTEEGPHLTTGQIYWLLEAARQEEAEAPARSKHLAVLAPVAVLALAGLRLGELCNLLLMDIETTRRRWRIHIREAKTAAGVRAIPVSGYLKPIVAEQLLRRKADGAGARSPLFATSAGTAIGKDNFRNRQWAKTIERANRLCAEHGENPIPGIDLVDEDGEALSSAPEGEVKATPHALRRSYITHMARLGTHPKKLMKWVGHKDAKVTIEIYERVEDDDDEDLDPLDERDPLLRALYGDKELATDNVVALPARGTVPAGV